MRRRDLCVLSIVVASRTMTGLSYDSPKNLCLFRAEGIDLTCDDSGKDLGWVSPEFADGLGASNSILGLVGVDVPL